MAKTKRKRFKCDTCPRKKFESAVELSEHFKDHPKHRNPRQQRQFDYSQGVRAERHQSGEIVARQSVNGLPTTKRATPTRRTQKFCTECGTRMMPSHNFCGGCGAKL